VDSVFFPLHPDTPAEGRSLASLFAGRNLDLRAMHERMAGLMRAEGLDYARRTHTYNSRLAQELGKWAESRGVEAIHDTLYRAYFVDGLNLADLDVLVDRAQSVGLPPHEARVVLVERRFKDAVDEDWNRARRYGISGVPTFVAGGRVVVGAQPSETLERLVMSAGARRRASPPSSSSSGQR
jgi:predicted DsbA family dithiol-disulfide isomerase